MSTEPPPERPAEPPAEPAAEQTSDPEQPLGGFARGQADPVVFPEDTEVGRFSEGQEVLGEEDPEKHHHGRFSEGQEVLGEDDPEKHIEGRFSTDEDAQPPGVAP
jgi:hypothetical protein